LACHKTNSSLQNNIDGSLNTLSTPAGTFTATYDSVGRPAGLTNPVSHSFSWSWLDNGCLSSESAARMNTAYTYNAAGLITDQITRRASDNQVLADFNGFAYDASDNPTSVTASYPLHSLYSGQNLYTFDTKNQLTQEASARNGARSLSRNNAWKPCLIGPAGLGLSFRLSLIAGLAVLVLQLPR
jgi:YD repeat-containing protein